MKLKKSDVMEEKNLSLLELVRQEANKRLRSKKENVHHEVCVSLVNDMERYNLPITILVYIGVSTCGHKPSMFLKGYKKYDQEKVDKVVKYCDIFAKKYGERYRSNAYVVHGICRYYDISNNERKFRELVKNSNIDMKSIKTSKDFIASLCGEEATYTSKGYMIKVNKCKK